MIFKKTSVVYTEAEKGSVRFSCYIYGVGVSKHY